MEQNQINNIIVKHYAGSHSYGTNIETSDIDIRGIYCGDEKTIRTPFFNEKEIVVADEEDSKLYELNHFMKLCLNCNPNIIESLWVDENDLIFQHETYKILREHRSFFLSKKIAFTTTGYAFAQLKRMKNHKKWINNPQPKEPPQEKNFVSLIYNFTTEKMFKFDIDQFNKDHRLVPYGKNIFGIIEEKGRTLYDNKGKLNTIYENVPADKFPLYLIKFNEEDYKKAKLEHEKYWSWKNNRNKKRADLEYKYGYDTKHAMHLVRLLRMGVEALEEGIILVKRPDAKELLDIRNGAWSYEKLIKYAEEMDKKINKLYKTTNKLKKRPNVNLAADIIIQIQNKFWGL